MHPHLTMRVARPTNHLSAIAQMYIQGLGLDVLAEFADHDGFDGIVLGRAGASYHIEFTAQRGESVDHVPTTEHLLVFYVPSRDEWRAMCESMEAAGFRPVPSGNPYWSVAGATFEDIEQYRVVLQNAAWNG